MKRYLILPLIFIMLLGTLAAQNVGIGVVTPAYKLDVSGTLHSTGNAIFEGNVGIGTANPTYKLEITDGSLGFINSTGSAFEWSIRPYNGLSFYRESTNVMNISNAGAVGIGMTNPQYKLDVDGSIHASYILDVDGTLKAKSNLWVYEDAIIVGSLTVNNGKGVAYNSTSSTNLKVAPFTTATFTAILPGFGLSGEGIFALPAGFTSPPRVFVGDINATGGTAGELYRVQLIVYGCTATSCKARLLNTSPNAVNYSITWNMLAVGN